jgi:hypothetical protein
MSCSWICSICSVDGMFLCFYVGGCPREIKSSLIVSDTL